MLHNFDNWRSIFSVKRVIINIVYVQVICKALINHRLSLYTFLYFLKKKYFLLNPMMQPMSVYYYNVLIFDAIYSRKIKCLTKLQFSNNIYYI